MTWCESNFSQFDLKLRLDGTRRERITSAYGRLLDYCKSHSELKAAMKGEPFFQGSFSYDTIIRPRNGAEFDIDVVYPFSLAVFGSPIPSGDALLNWFVKQLCEDADYKKRIVKMPRCARLDYAGDFHLDIVMSTNELHQHQPYAVPTRDLANWITNDPIGMIQWVNALSQRSTRTPSQVERFVRCVRMMKRWRDELPANETPPSSILLLTMLGHHEANGNYNPPLDNRLFPEYNTDASYLYDMARLTLSCIRLSGDRSFMHPTIAGDNLASAWKKDDQPKFEKQLELFVSRIGQGIFAKTDSESIIFYKQAFGESFPS